MGAEDVRRQALNVFRIEMLGAKVLDSDRGLPRTILIYQSGHTCPLGLANT